MKKKEVRITTRVTQKEKEKISAASRRRGLSMSEYLRQRALGYTPKATPSTTLFPLCEKLDALLGRGIAPEINMVTVNQRSGERGKNIAYHGNPFQKMSD